MQDAELSKHTEAEEKHNQSLVTMINDVVEKFSNEVRLASKEYREENEKSLMQTKEELIRMQANYELQHKSIEKDIKAMNDLNEQRFKAIEKEQDRGYKENVESNKQLVSKVTEGNKLMADVATRLSEHLSYHKGVEFSMESNKCKFDKDSCR